MLRDTLALPNGKLPVNHIFGAPLESTVRILPLVYTLPDGSLIIYDGTVVGQADTEANRLMTEHACYPIVSAGEHEPSQASHALHVGRDIVRLVLMALQGTQLELSLEDLEKKLPLTYLNDWGRLCLGNLERVLLMRDLFCDGLHLACAELIHSHQRMRAKDVAELSVTFSPRDLTGWALLLHAHDEANWRARRLEDAAALLDQRKDASELAVKLDVIANTYLATHR